jgi:dTDP-4-dehydrorhamnose reductase
VVTDEVTTPTSTAALAQQVRRLAEHAAPGLYHATCQGACSWYEFARAIFDETHTPAHLVPVASSEFPSPVKRPAYSVLDNARARQQNLDLMPPWREALRAYLQG